jgi:presenilin-like A22 family membrane protease
MLIETALYIAIMGLLIGGTRFALARPANWCLTFGPPGEAAPLRSIVGIFLTATTAYEVTGIMYPLRAPSIGTPYITIVAVAGIAVLLARDAARSVQGRVAVLAVAAAAGGAWIFAETWLTYTIAAAFLAFALIALVRLSLPFWWWACMMIFVAAQDYHDVIATHATQALAAAIDPFDASNHVVHVNPSGVPGLIGFPVRLAMLSPYATAIGIGDITLAGVLIVIAGRIGRQAGTAWLYRAGVIGYAIGLAATRVTGDVTRSPQPALCFLIPGVIIAVAVAAWRTGTWSALASVPPPFRLAASAGKAEPRGDAAAGTA